jgi:hypothetical protein
VDVTLAGDHISAITGFADNSVWRGSGCPPFLE